MPQQDRLIAEEPTPALRSPTASVSAVRAAARPITGGSSDYAELFDLARGTRFVLLGAATDGTHELYAERARITKALIEGLGFTDIAIEADWPDAYRVHRYSRGMGGDTSARDALRGFERFPAWTWRNEDVLELVGWLRAYNHSVAEPPSQVGFHGLDLYSTRASMHAVVDHLEQVDAEAARAARRHHGCLDRVNLDPRDHALATDLRLGASREREVVRTLHGLRARALDGVRADGIDVRDEPFYAEQNARLARSAEAYYGAMFRGPEAWRSQRARHMAETLDALVKHLEERRGTPARVIVWAHTMHLGDARATEMGEHGELNMGELVRETHGREALLVGFTTYQGTVAAASGWDEPVQTKRVPPAGPGTYEALFHETGIPRFLVVLEGGGEAAEALRGPMLERAIGVVYRPEIERPSPLFRARLPDQLDVVVHLDETTAVEPLDRSAGWATGDREGTFSTRL